MTGAPILLVEDDDALRDALGETLHLAGYEVVTATDGGDALGVLAERSVAAVITDYQMKPVDGFALLRSIRERRPRLPVLLMTAHGSIDHAVRCMLEGATDYLAKPFQAAVLLEKLRQILVRQPVGDGVVAADPAMRELLELARRVAASDATVLVTGESGTGKEVIARYLHERSRRAAGPFVAINCAAIPENMLEALLFGHEKGAFTGAHDSRAGKFEQAQGGTLLLDEISEMDLALQAKLLRVLQEREVERIGGRAPIALDVRVIATTNRDLRRQVDSGRFREDLYYRLSVFPLAIPPLRERPADVLPLARHFLAAAAGPDGSATGLADEAAAALATHPWPGNVRELSNVMQRALILCNGNLIRARDLRFESDGQTAVPVAAADAPSRRERQADPSLGENLQNVEGHLIVDALARTGSRQRAAEALGISPRTLRYKIARLRDAGIPIPGGREIARTPA